MFMRVNQMCAHQVRPPVGRVGRSAVRQPLPTLRTDRPRPDGVAPRSLQPVEVLHMPGAARPSRENANGDGKPSGPESDHGHHVKLQTAGRVRDWRHYSLDSASYPRGMHG
jgi:hypothetical protein